ncbi:helix-turn-helix domain-containing protein [Marivivens donghaensis]|uniref:arsenate reductase/protein-tyrosine-phosphatase family protein n=1 Tax=Marivivens donghaensis TaxID=1699413 RepID=UPI00201F1CB0|nr:helix-turn-helix domain-containing protein [Marivivens donghaensis]MCL7407896.1 helix-turn-helix domain-containing protein [Marivivens donghaensis]MDN3704125.1 helix-turn-helix domain-containing protein [Marivivens donghaensis]
MKTAIPDLLSTLGHPQRLSVFQLLMRRYPDHVPAGEISDALGIKGSTLSNYLSALQTADLIDQERSGTSLRYCINMTTVQQMFDGLLVDCCRGRPDLCLAPQPKPPSRPYTVLFICTGNSARSIFAETILRDLGGDRFNVYSAGTKPYSELNPFALEVLGTKGHDTSQLRAKNVSEFTGPNAPDLDFVFTVCNQAANEECPAWDGQPISGHWGMPDPVKATGTDAEKSLAFQEAYGALRNRIEQFIALPITTLDRIALQKAVDTIGRQTSEDHL